MDLSPGPVDLVDPSQMFTASDHTGTYQGLVAGAYADAGGSGGAVDDARTSIAGLVGVDTSVDLGPLEGDLAASQADDDSGLPALTLTDEVTATDALGSAADSGMAAAGAAGDAHDALSSQIDDGQGEIPQPPATFAPSGDPPTDTNIWVNGKPSA